MSLLNLESFGPNLLEERWQIMNYLWSVANSNSNSWIEKERHILNCMYPSHKHTNTLPYSSEHMSCVSKHEAGSLGWQKIRPCMWQTALTVMHNRCIDRCTSSHCPGSSVTERRKRPRKKAWKEGGGNHCFRAPWGWLLTDRPDPAGPDGLGGGPQVPRRVPLVLRVDSCSFPWGETERKREQDSL